MNPVALAIHGGCGVMAKLDLSEEEWQAARADLAASLRAGWAVLARGGSALDAVEAAVVVMEDSPHFNAGYGAALNENAEHELDASIMDGSNLDAGAICAASRIKNPVRAARAVMEKSGAVLLTGPAADRFAERCGLDIVAPGYFTTERRQKALAAMKAHARAGTFKAASEAEKHGTVGAVALDRAGHLAAATSTGGYNNKPEGRVGDSPIIGAGTYARDGVCAVSGTGQGEFFIRHVVGHEIASRITYLGETLEAAAHRVIREDLKSYGIGAGAVAVDGRGDVSAPYNTDGMFRGWVTREGRLHVASHSEVFFVETLAGGRP
ncbi:isoaspartyl peptidase/L-asparaginase family protein [Nitratireductor sp. ZSWI3]|uniref:isoaspartyl peptidase/L-asparaginase family protein n=1 Tax=Nitratireductor sp. ZSWI3 TaxID=2966359 RepID=UPI00214F8B5F|nr:isoaspartyl peptidase/L-asparaginase [Nitratireductor sp. ZSWI3]MCR4265386.1 isoaspartyl peptidase/L-asparaginase [Nitratireductor sp. ZSWI3]